MEKSPLSKCAGNCPAGQGQSPGSRRDRLRLDTVLLIDGNVGDVAIREAVGQLLPDLDHLGVHWLRHAGLRTGARVRRQLGRAGVRASKIDLEIEPDELARKE